MAETKGDKVVSFSKKNDNVRKRLTECIGEILCDTRYNLLSLHYDSRNFGNVVVELESCKLAVRFICDRGDIYRARKALDSERWVDERLVCNHTESCDTPYGLLLEAIEELVRCG